MSDDDTDKRGSGETIVELGEYKIQDDGYNDWDCAFVHDDGGRIGSISGLRQHVGDDERFAELIAGRDDPGVDPSDFERKPVAFKCKGCNETFPRTMNDGNDYCPDCSDDDDE